MLRKAAAVVVVFCGLWIGVANWSRISKLASSLSASSSAANQSPQLKPTVVDQVLPPNPPIEDQGATAKPEPDNSPSLEVTMKFIQDELNEVGKVNYVAHYHNNSNAEDWINHFNTDRSNVIADPANCRIASHWKAVRDGRTISNSNYFLSLHDVQEFAVRTGEQNQKKIDIDSGQPELDAQFDPPIFVLVARKSGNLEDNFMFHDLVRANSVANAMKHAMELCRGGAVDGTLPQDSSN